MMGKVDEYEALLRQVSSQVDGATQLAIQKALTKVGDPALLLFWSDAEVH